MKTLNITIGFPVTFELNVPMELYSRAKNGDLNAISEIRNVAEQQGKQLFDIEKSYSVVACCPELEVLQD